MDLKRIRHALALAEEMNFGRAAEKVHLSQPAFSRSIQALENELGMTLFDRGKQGLAITTVGTRFLARAKALVQEARNLERDMELTRSGEIGQISFGVGPLPASSMAPRLLQQLRQGRPEFRVSLLVNNSQYLLTYLLEEEIEFFIADTHDVPLNDAISITPLARQSGTLICRAGHPLLARDTPQLRDLVRYGFASMKLPRSPANALRQVLGLRSGQALPIALECDDISALTQVVCNDDLILIATQAAVAREIAAGQLCPLAVSDFPPLFAEMGIVQLHGRTLSPAAQLVIATLKEQVKGQN